MQNFIAKWVRQNLSVVVILCSIIIITIWNAKWRTFFFDMLQYEKKNLVNSSPFWALGWWCWNAIIYKFDGASVIERYGWCGFILRHLAAFVLLHCQFIANELKKCGKTMNNCFEIGDCKKKSNHSEWFHFILCFFDPWFRNFNER